MPKGMVYNLLQVSNDVAIINGKGHNIFLVTDTFIYAYDVKMGYIDIDSHLVPILIYTFLLQTLTIMCSHLYEEIFPHIQSDTILV